MKLRATAIAAAARVVAAPGTEIVALQPDFGPASIEGHAEEAIAAAGVADVVLRSRHLKPDAVIVATKTPPTRAGRTIS